MLCPPGKILLRLFNSFPEKKDNIREIRHHQGEPEPQMTRVDMEKAICIYAV